MNLAEARDLDQADPLGPYREAFHHPTDHRGDRLVYLCGHSLGLAPVRAADAVDEALSRWAEMGVEGHFGDGPEWYRYDEPIGARLAPLVGARPSDVAVMGTLTSNLHLLLASFFRPIGSRTALLIEKNAFPSDRYVAQTQLQWHGLDPDTQLVEWCPGDDGLLHLDDLDTLLAERGDQVGCALLGGVNYATGQRLDLEAISSRLHGHGVMVGYDLAHAVGNVDVDLAASGADFAAWCSYKYLNSGPGAVASLFVAPQHGDDTDRVRLGGWWGNDPTTRFHMDVERQFVPVAGAAGWRQSNPPIFSLAPLGASLEVFASATMTMVHEKSRQLNQVLETLLAPIEAVTTLTPTASDQRGAQTSLRIADGVRVADRLRAEGIVVDVRPPDIIRLAPVPLYNRFEDVWLAADALARALH